MSLKSVTNTFLCVEINSYLNNPRIHAYANKKYADIHQSSCIHVAFYHVHYDLFYSLRCIITFSPFLQRGIWGWSGGATVLGKLPVPGPPTILGYSVARAYGDCSRCGWGWFGHFFSRLSFLSPSLWETARYRLKYCL